MENQQNNNVDKSQRIGWWGYSSMAVVVFNLLLPLEPGYGIGNKIYLYIVIGLPILGISLGMHGIIAKFVNKENSVVQSEEEGTWIFAVLNLAFLVYRLYVIFYLGQVYLFDQSYGWIFFK